MLPAKCHKATVICLLSLHTFRTTHSSHCHLSVCWCVCACVCPLGLLSPMSSLRILCNQQTFGHRIPQTGIQHTQLSANFPTLSPMSSLSSLPPPSASALALILVSAACCYCCSFPPHSLGSLNGQAAVAVAILLCQQSPSPLSTQALNRIKNILCIWYVRWRIKCFYLPWQRKK